MTNVLIAAYIFCSVFTTQISNDIPVSNSNQAQNSAVTTINNYFQKSNRLSAEKAQIKIDDANRDYIEELKKLGYFKDSSGNKYLNIRNAIIRFQAEHNMFVDGNWGAVSLSTLKERLIHIKFNYPDEVQEAPTKGKWILINKSKRILTLYENKGVIKKYPIAVGNPPSLTPQGKFSIVLKAVEPTWGGGGYAEPISGGDPSNPLGHRWIGLSPNGGSTYGIHGNASPYSIGTYASHGCIRMINSDVEELYEIVSIDTPVWICTDDVLKEWQISQTDYLTYNRDDDTN